jgi:hypothetical protein
MRRWFAVLLAAVLGGGAALPAPPNSPANAGKVDAGRLPAGHLAGKLLSVPDSDRMFTVAVTYPQVVPNPNQDFRGAAGLRWQYNHILQLQQQLAQRRTRNPAGTLAQLQRAVAQFQLQLTRAQLNAVRVVHVTQNVDFQAAEEVKVRTLQPAAAFDDKGNIKKYTPAELRQLKGKDPGLPGFESAAEDLKAGQTVQVALAPHRAARTGDQARGAEKDGGKDAPAGKKMQAAVIVIVDDAGAGQTPPRGKDSLKGPR